MKFLLLILLVFAALSGECEGGSCFIQGEIPIGPEQIAASLTQKTFGKWRVIRVGRCSVSSQAAFSTVTLEDCLLQHEDTENTLALDATLLYHEQCLQIPYLRVYHPTLVMEAIGEGSVTTHGVILAFPSFEGELSAWLTCSGWPSEAIPCHGRIRGIDDGMALKMTPDGTVVDWCWKGELLDGSCSFPPSDLAIAALEGTCTYSSNDSSLRVECLSGELVCTRDTQIWATVTGEIRASPEKLDFDITLIPAPPCAELKSSRFVGALHHLDAHSSLDLDLSASSIFGNPPSGCTAELTRDWRVMHGSIEFPFTIDLSSHPIMAHFLPELLLQGQCKIAWDPPRAPRFCLISPEKTALPFCISGFWAENKGSIEEGTWKRCRFSCDWHREKNNMIFPSWSADWDGVLLLGGRGEYSENRLQGKIDLFEWNYDTCKQEAFPPLVALFPLEGTLRGKGTFLLPLDRKNRVWECNLDFPQQTMRLWSLPIHVNGSLMLRGPEVHTSGQGAVHFLFAQDVRLPPTTPAEGSLYFMYDSSEIFLTKLKKTYNKDRSVEFSLNKKNPSKILWDGSLDVSLKLTPRIQRLTLLPLRVHVVGNVGAPVCHLSNPPPMP